MKLNVQYAMWSLVLLRLLIPFHIGHSVLSLANFQPPLPLPAVQEEIRLPAEDHTAVLPELRPAPQMEQHSQAEKPGVSGEKIMEMTLTGIWIAGALVVGGMFLRANLVFWSRLKESRHLLRKGRLPVYVTNRIESPCLFGILHPAVYVTGEVAADPVAFRHTLAHERCHYGHKDHIWAALRGLCLVIHWYNPLVWWAAILSQRDGEMACDESTIRTLGEAERKEYGKTLIHVSCQENSHLLTAATTMTSDKKVLKERIMMITKKPKTFWTAMIGAVVLSAVFVGCTFTGAKEPESTTGLTTTEPTSGLTVTETIPVLQTTPATEEGKAPEQLQETLPVKTEQSENAGEDKWADHPDGIRIENITGENYKAHAMLIKDPSRVYLGVSSQELSNSVPGKRIDEVMEEQGAVAAINAGDYYDDGTAGIAVGATPLGLVYSGGVCAWESGTPDEQGFAGFNKDNVLVVKDQNISKEEAEALNIRDGCCFGPALIIDGVPNQAAYDQSSGINARTAIGQREDGTVIFLCIDGRQPESLGGMTRDVLELMQQLGAVNACNMGGGSSTGMMYQDTLGHYGEAGEAYLVNHHDKIQTLPRRLPDYWMVRPEG